MENFSNKIEKNIEIFKMIDCDNSDTNIRNIKIGGKKIAIIFRESVSSDDKISNFTMRSLSYDIKEKKKFVLDDFLKYLENTLPNSKLKKITGFDQLFYYLSSGFTCVFVDGYDEVIALETKATLDRGISESTSETIIRGPKDSFTENHMTNLGLIRKRIKDKNLVIKEQLVGRRTSTKVSVTYIKDIADLELVDQIVEKIKNIDIDGVLESGYIRELIFDDEKTVFPIVNSTERPDLACAALLSGKIAILVENTPFVIIVPAFFVDFFHVSEDYYQKSNNITFTRIIRIIAFFISVLTPSLYIAITTFNQEILPDKLLISFTTQRFGVPFPTIIECLLMLLTFEILRESDLRLPTPIGSSISIVGALVLGDAAVTAGIVSPIMIIVIAITAMSNFIFNDIEFVNAIRWWRLIYMFFASIIGFMGVVVASFLFITKLSSITSVGRPYLSAIAPFDGKLLNQLLFRKSRTKMTKRNKYINSKNLTRQKEANNNENS